MTPGNADPDRRGLTSADARARLKQFGPNAVLEEKVHPLKNLLGKFWTPIPWLLEATIIIHLLPEPQNHQNTSACGADRPRSQEASHAIRFENPADL